MVALKIADEFGIVTERARQREQYADIIERRVEAYFSSPQGQARIAREVDAHLKREVDELIARKTRERIAEIERMEMPSGPAIGDLLALASEVTGCPVAEIVGPRRARECAYPRFFAIHLMIVMRPDLSLPAIGRAFGGRDHTTIMAARNKFAKVRDGQPFAQWLADPRAVELLADRPQVERRRPFGNPHPVAEAA